MAFFTNVIPGSTPTNLVNCSSLNFRGVSNGKKQSDEKLFEVVENNSDGYCMVGENYDCSNQPQ